MGKAVVVAILLAILAGAIWFFKMNAPEAVKAYMEYRKAATEQQIMGEWRLSVDSWELKVDSSTVSGDTASIEATEEVSWWIQAPGRPAHIIKVRKYSVQMQKQNDSWLITSEELLSEEKAAK